MIHLPIYSHNKRRLAKLFFLIEFFRARVQRQCHAGLRRCLRYIHALRMGGVQAIRIGVERFTDFIAKLGVDFLRRDQKRAYRNGRYRLIDARICASWNRRHRIKGILGDQGVKARRLQRP